MIYYALDSRYLINLINCNLLDLCRSQKLFLAGCVTTEIWEIAEYVAANGTTIPPSFPDFHHELVSGETIMDRTEVLWLRETRLHRGIEFLFTFSDFLASEQQGNNTSETQPVAEPIENDFDEPEEGLDAKGPLITPINTVQDQPQGKVSSDVEVQATFNQQGDTTPETQPVNEPTEDDFDEPEERLDAIGPLITPTNSAQDQPQGKVSSDVEVQTDSNQQLSSASKFVENFKKFQEERAKAERQREFLLENTYPDEGKADFNRLREKDLSLYGDIIPLLQELKLLLATDIEYLFGVEFYNTYYRHTPASQTSEDGKPVRTRSQRLHDRFRKEFAVFFGWLATECSGERTLHPHAVLEAAIGSLREFVQNESTTGKSSETRKENTNVEAVINTPSEENRQKLFDLFGLAEHYETVKKIGEDQPKLCEWIDENLTQSLNLKGVTLPWTGLKKTLLCILLVNSHRWLEGEEIGQNLNEKNVTKEGTRDLPANKPLSIAAKIKRQDKNRKLGRQTVSDLETSLKTVFIPSAGTSGYIIDRDSVSGGAKSYCLSASTLEKYNVAPMPLCDQIVPLIDASNSTS